jgi:hypothetical protein
MQIYNTKSTKINGKCTGISCPEISNDLPLETPNTVWDSNGVFITSCLRKKQKHKSISGRSDLRICRFVLVTHLLKFFNGENLIIRGCKWNETVSNRKCNNFQRNESMKLPW